MGTKLLGRLLSSMMAGRKRRGSRMDGPEYLSAMPLEDMLAIWRERPIASYAGESLYAMVARARRTLERHDIDDTSIASDPPNLLRLASLAALELSRAEDRSDLDCPEVEQVEDAIGTLSWAAACLEQPGAADDLVLRLSSISHPEMLDQAWFECLRVARHRSESQRKRPLGTVRTDDEAEAGNPSDEFDFGQDLDLGPSEDAERSMFDDIPEPTPVWRKHPPSRESGAAVREKVAAELSQALTDRESAERFSPPDLQNSTAEHLALAQRVASRSERDPIPAPRNETAKVIECALWLAVYDMWHCAHEQTRAEAVLLWEKRLSGSGTEQEPAPTPWLVHDPLPPMSDLMFRRVSEYLVSAADRLPIPGRYDEAPEEMRPSWGKLRAHLRSERASTNPDTTRALLRAVTDTREPGDHAWATAAWMLCAMSEPEPPTTSEGRTRAVTEARLRSWVDGSIWAVLMRSQGVASHQMPHWRSTDPMSEQAIPARTEVKARLLEILSEEIPAIYQDTGVYLVEDMREVDLQTAARAMHQVMRDIAVGGGAPALSAEAERRMRRLHEGVGLAHWLRMASGHEDKTGDLSRHRALSRDMAGTLTTLQAALASTDTHGPASAEKARTSPVVPPPSSAHVAPPPRHDRSRLVVPVEGDGASHLGDTVQFCSVLATPLRVSAWPDAHQLSMTLAREFPWAEELVDTLRSQLLLAERVSGRRAERLPPLCLIGPGGVGKSRIARRICEIVKAAGGPSHATLNMGGSSDNRTLAGTARGWSNAYPTFPSAVMARTRCPNPLLVMEEVDKAGGDRGRTGNPHDTLLAMLDPSTSGNCLDEGLGLKVDMSLVSWIMTANRRDGIPALLRARMRFVEIPPPRARDFDVLLQGCLGDVASEFGADVENLPDILPEAVQAMRHGFESGGLTARGMAKVVRRALTAGAEADLGATRH